MDFSRRGMQKKQNLMESKAVHLHIKANIITLWLVILLSVFGIVVGVVGVTGIIRAMIAAAPEVTATDLSTITSGQSTGIYDSQGNRIDTLVGAQGKREYVKIEDVPRMVRNCFLACEDARFYEHAGLDLRNFLNRVYQIAKGTAGKGKEGTITQKLLRQQVFGSVGGDSLYEKLERKIQESYLTVVTENNLSKNQILEYYLNCINLGNNAWGVQTAAKTYFNKNVWELTLSEASVLAPISGSPTKLNPITYPEENAQSRKMVLNTMLALGTCTEEEYKEAMEDPVYERIAAVAAAKKEVTYNSYFTDEVISQVAENLIASGYTAEQAEKLLYSGGLSIYTTQDPQIQDICDEVFADPDNFPAVGEGSHYELNYALSVVKADGSTVNYQLSDLKEYFKKKGFRDPQGLYVHEGDYYFTEIGYSRTDMLDKCAEFRKAVVKTGDRVSGERKYVTLQPQCAMTVMDQSTGHVVAIVGGRGEQIGNRTQERATGTLRQPGTAFQVLASFLPALDTAGMTLATVFDDAPYEEPSSKQNIVNWEWNAYEGLIGIRRSIYSSKNITAVKALIQIGPRLGADYLKKLGFSHLIESSTDVNGNTVSDITPLLAIGTMTGGVTNLEMTAGYAAIANGGNYIKPIFYTKVIDAQGNVLLSNEAQETRVLKASTAYLLTDAMEDAVIKGTGWNLQFTECQIPLAGKTGVSQNGEDLWVVGYTPYYTATIWSGCDNPDKQEDTTYHQDIWRKIMERIHLEKALVYKDFAVPESLVTATICTKCGKLAIEGLCSQAIGASVVATEIFAKGTAPTESCNCHLAVTLCRQTGKYANEYCPETGQIVYLIKQEMGETSDTPWILPSGEDTTCSKHTLQGMLDQMGVNGIPESETLLRQ